MKSVSGKELAKLVERHGWELLRIHGSHHIYGKKGSTVRLSIPPISWQIGLCHAWYTPCKFMPLGIASLFDFVRVRGYHGREALLSMTREELLARISINPEICFGKPCIRGHRIWVSLVLDFLSSGMTNREVMDEYGLEEADILACIAYGAEMARERYVEIPLDAR